MDVQNVAGKKVLIVGLGLQGGGVGAARFFAKRGANVTITDLKTESELKESIDVLSAYDIRFVLNGHKLEDFINTELIIKGPSVPWTLPELQEAEKKQIPIEMETAVFVEKFAKQVVGITGTRGKSTTAQMLFDSLTGGSQKIHLGGNIPGQATIELLDRVGPSDLVVLELSSWQLSGFHRKKISPHIGLFTNFYPDHLDYYRRLEDYFFDKSAIYRYQNQNDFFIVNKKLEQRVLKDNPHGKVMEFSQDDFLNTLQNVEGDHNRENAAAALMVHKVLGRNLDEAANRISQFGGLAYRQQIVFRNKNLIIVNDSSSTTPVATIQAIKTFKNRNIVLLLGGNSKRLPAEELIEKLSLVKRIVLLEGSFTNEVFSKLKLNYPEKLSKIYSDLRGALTVALESAEQATEQTVILFSPGATSFSSFKNEFDRGKQFDQAVQLYLKQ